MNTTLRTITSIFLVVLAFMVMGLGMVVDGVLNINEFSVSHIPANIASLNAHSPRFFVVESGSMEPNIKTASVVMVRPEKFYLPGDVITFRANGNKDTIVTHRIHEKSITETGATVYSTKGDANEDIDLWEVSDTQILGKTTFTVPFLGYAVEFAKTPKGFIALIIIPATIIVYEELKFLFSETRSALKKKTKNVSPSRIPKVSILVPVIAAGVVFIATTSAFYSDREESMINTISASNAYESSLVINEFLSLPVEETSEWIEIYNPTDTEIDLTSWSLTTSSTTVDLTSHGSVAGHSFAVLETVNALSDSGDTIKLISPDPTIIDIHTYATPEADKSIGRETDAATPFKGCTQQTKGATNNGSC